MRAIHLGGRRPGPSGQYKKPGSDVPGFSITSSGDGASSGADGRAKVASDPVIQWQDVGPFFRDFSATFQGKVYALPLDGDFHMIYYRSDILAKDGVAVPATWDDYQANLDAANDHPVPLDRYLELLAGAGLDAGCIDCRADRVFLVARRPLSSPGS